MNKISRSEQKQLLNRAPLFDDGFHSLRSAPKLPRTMIKEARKVVAIARKFTETVIRPYALELDRTIQQDPDFLPWEFIKKANEWGFYSMWIPKIFGGKGYSIPTLALFLEETSRECLAMSNLIGVHYLGVGTLFATWNIRLINEILTDVANGEKTGEPVLISLAHTEPGAGTDLEETELMDQGTITCRADRVPGGIKINGTKVFISSGHMSKWHMTTCFEDPERPSSSAVIAAVKTGSEGFSFGRKERKMGQKGCPASELIFKDCFVPDDYVAADFNQLKTLKRDITPSVSQLIDYIVATSRAGVAAWGVGAARGALEDALAFAMETEVGGKLLVNHEWVQIRLAEMHKNVSLARLSYIETNYANGLEGMFKIIQFKPVYYMLKTTPHWAVERFIAPFLSRSLTTRVFRYLQMDRQTDDQIARTTGWASLAKVSGTDAGICNCHLALEIMGQAGLRQDRRTEKILRDAKLLQIYEGTNQLNRLNVFKSLVGRNIPEIKLFAHE
ncbi:MAG: acyl-CoA dehydrogenase family protein [Thermodesulfobacteriota bacterium]|nr:acyl-CoA dehydrogenase family protein [Thermodesulfobacteriota bacterium]